MPCPSLAQFQFQFLASCHWIWSYIVLVCNCELCWFPRDCHPLPRVVWQKIPLALGLGGISCELRLSLGQAAHCKCLLIEKAVPQVPPGLPFFAIMALRREAVLPGVPMEDHQPEFTEKGGNAVDVFTVCTDFILRISFACFGRGLLIWVSMLGLGFGSYFRGCLGA